jgi:predicted negative regulator of RcsB-dependent stress response
MTAAGVCGPALALLMACASSAPAPPALTEAPSAEEGRVRRAWEELPGPSELADSAERGDLGRAREELAHAERARASGDLEHEAAVRRSAGEALGHLADVYPASAYRLVYRRAAAETLLVADDPEAAAGEAERLRADPAAGPSDRAGGARLAALALRRLLEREVKEGLAPPVEVVRKTELKPTEPGGTAKRLLDAIDAYTEREADDPRPGADAEAASLDLFAAEVVYAHDLAALAQGRLEALFRRFPLTEAAVEGVGPYLQTFAARHDMKGYAEAVERMRAELEQERPRAVELSQAPRAGADQANLPALIDSVLAQLAGEGDRMEFASAMDLLKAGKSAEAAVAFERYAEGHPDARDAPAALHNAGVAYGRARQPRRSQAALQRLLTRYPDAPEAAPATLALATNRLDAGDGPGAAQLYQRYLRRWPDGERRCLALVNLGAAQEQADRPLEAASHYLAYGKDETCADEDPSTAAHALSTAGHLYLDAGSKDEARLAFRLLVHLRGELDAEAKSQLAEARQELETLK